VIWWAVPAFAAAAYYLLVLIAAARWRPTAGHGATPSISLLKPMYGRDPSLYEALRSHAVQDYPKFEILFGVRDANDPALQDIRRLQAEFPSVPMRLIMVEGDAPNAKALTVARLAEHAAHPILIINDDDILVQPGYFRAVAAPFEDPRTGVVTCLFRGRAGSWPALMEALNISTEFAPSVMVARLLGVIEFAVGATMAVRANVLREIGGFEPISDYLADDYQLGFRATKKGYRVEFAAAVVETGLGDGNWREVWKHQLRWSRTVRVSRPSGYYGYIITNATLWALLAFAAGQWWPGAIALVFRVIAGWVVGAGIVKDREVRRWFWLLPVRDLFSLAVWIGGCFGTTVYWRGRKLRLHRDGRLK
jgi:ceramide glucosyltransferase